MDSSDERNLLVWEFARLVGELQPRVFVMENVAALATHQKWQNVRERLMREFKDHGYEVNQLILNSRNYGVAQSRERVFFIGTAKHIDPISAVDPLDPCMYTVYDVLKGLPPPGKHPNMGACKAKVTLARNPDLRKSPYAGLLLNGGGRPVNLHAPINTLLASMGGNKTPVIDEQALRSGGPSWFEEHHQRLTRGEEVSSEEPPPYIRRLSVTEAALLQSFPLTFQFVGSQSSQFRQIGNAVPPKLAHSIAAAAAQVLRSDAAKK
ncbi:EcoT38I methyltransferase [Acanthamoeba castellanii str. Neff]|uniref:DNA (cytosine-5-)-methyltransferase n=1 Tax=Acanthamoeba castellanii (strain ATCC 30010 / Neff) TaxID=1257118 RepID=L8GQZ3_ACACF|nr:EcoT38I methyltransferase [Acanthamoeba castellanii str. Neff]ELR15347.1 EcoT38I methyltransferase [Acanthamoeba castellanii str. Neff]